MSAMTTSWSRFKGEYAKNRPGIGGIGTGRKQNVAFDLSLALELSADELPVCLAVDFVAAVSG